MKAQATYAELVTFEGQVLNKWHLFLIQAITIQLIQIVTHILFCHFTEISQCVYIDLGFTFF